MENNQGGRSRSRRDTDDDSRRRPWVLYGLLLLLGLSNLIMGGFGAAAWHKRNQANQVDGLRNEQLDNDQATLDMQYEQLRAKDEALLASLNMTTNLTGPDLFSLDRVGWGTWNPTLAQPNEYGVQASEGLYSEIWCFPFNVSLRGLILSGDSCSQLYDGEQNINLWTSVNGATPIYSSPLVTRTDPVWSTRTSHYNGAPGVFNRVLTYAIENVTIPAHAVFEIALTGVPQTGNPDEYRGQFMFERT